MTTFECKNGHRFGAPEWRRPDDSTEASSTTWCCPACKTERFRVVELGGKPSATDPCEGSCTL